MVAQSIVMALAPVAALLGLSVPVGVHRVPEGHVGVYWRGGKLLDRTTGPGFHFMWPGITSFSAVQVTVQTDKVTDIPCGTSGGTIIMFDRIEVVNQLKAAYVHDTIKNYTTDYDKTWIYDKIHHEINQFCSSRTLEEVYISKFDTLDESLKDALSKDLATWAPGIEIIGIRVTKPRVPATIKANYEKIEAEVTKLSVAVETQRLVEKEAETERKRALIQARKEAEVAQVTLEMQLADKQQQQRLAEIENEMLLAQAKAAADAEFYRAQREAEANALRITPELIQLEAVRAIANNSKIYFGEKIPSMFADTGSLLSAAPAASTEARS